MREQALAIAIFIEGPWNPENAIAAIADVNRAVRHMAMQALGVHRQTQESTGFVVRMTFIDTRFDNELAAGLSFLQQFSGERIDKFFAFLRDNTASLFVREQSYLATNHADLEIGDRK